METLFIVVGIAALLFVVMGVVGSIFNFAANAIRTLFSIALLSGAVLAAIWFFNGQSLPF